MSAHLKKKIAPIIVTMMMLVCFAVYFNVLISLITFLLLMIRLGIVALAPGSSMIFVCRQRMK